jgi:hypothetical protein
MMQKETNVVHGLKWGIIIGIVYCLFLFLRYNQGAKNPMLFGLWTLVGYIIVLVMLLICGINRKKKLGGYIELKDAFQTMFMAVIGFEFLYMAFNFLYLKIVDPDFFDNFKVAMENLLEKSNIDREQIDKRLENFDKDAAKNMNLAGSFTSFAFSIMMSGIFALIFALLIRKKREPFQSFPENV